jgi:hypothetical protein
MVIISEWIPGCMLGIEFPDRMFVLDFFIVRFMFIWGLSDEERKDLGLD